MGTGCADAGGNNTGGGSRSQLRRQHAPRGAPHDGATWMGGRPPPAGDEDEAADGGARGAEGPAGPPPHAAPPPAHRAAARDRQTGGPAAGAEVGPGCSTVGAQRGPFGGRCTASRFRNHRLQKSTASRFRNHWDRPKGDAVHCFSLLVVPSLLWIFYLASSFQITL